MSMSGQRDRDEGTNSFLVTIHSRDPDKLGNKLIWLASLQGAGPLKNSDIVSFVKGPCEQAEALNEWRCPNVYLGREGEDGEWRVYAMLLDPGAVSSVFEAFQGASGKRDVPAGSDVNSTPLVCAPGSEEAHLNGECNWGGL